MPSAHPGKGKEGREVKGKVERGYGQRLGWSGAGTGKGCLVLKNSLKSLAVVRKQDTLRTADAPLTAPLTAGPCSLSPHEFRPLIIGHSLAVTFGPTQNRVCLSTL